MGSEKQKKNFKNFRGIKIIFYEFMEVPKYIKKYFWDVDTKNLDKDKYKDFIIERLLELGDKKSILWLKKNFNIEDIKRVVISSKRITKKSKNFWMKNL